MIFSFFVYSDGMAVSAAWRSGALVAWHVIDAFRGAPVTDFFFHEQRKSIRFLPSFEA